MTEFVMIVPSRGRPTAAEELAQVFADTCQADTLLVFAVDDNDETQDEYIATAQRFNDVAIGLVSQPSTMVHALNQAAMGIINTMIPPPFAVGFMGDDHRPRTVGWDKSYLDALRDLGTGIVYGNDLLQGENLPTQCAMTTDIPRMLQYIAPPNLRHLWVDNFWMMLGSQCRCLRYLPEVIVEHMHPVANKNHWDDGYARVNAPEVYQADHDAFRFYVENRFGHDVAALKAMIGQ